MVPAGRAIEAIADSRSAHRHAKVQAGCNAHPRWTFRFTPTAESWPNAIETFSSALTRKRIRRGSFHPIVGLKAVINRHPPEHNADPKPFVWISGRNSAAGVCAMPEIRARRTTEQVCPTRFRQGNAIAPPSSQRKRCDLGHILAIGSGVSGSRY